MARHKDVNWCLPEGAKQADGSNVHQDRHIYMALLMDIRDELKKLNALFNCPMFLDVPYYIKSIRNSLDKKGRRSVVPRKHRAPRR